MFSKAIIAILLITFASSYVIQFDEVENIEKVGNGTYKPVVQMHGMGDFADNPLGMIPLKKMISARLGGSYCVNAKLGDIIITDELSEFLQIMWHEVDSFKKFVDSDPKLAKGFNAVGYSQGNIIIRGYIEKYNNPPVYNFVSVHGPHIGVAGFPKCPYAWDICKLWDDFLGDLAYLEVAQDVLAQANYYRDPLRIPAYLNGSNFLPYLNNEVSPNATFKENFISLDSLALVKADKDTMIWPNDSEWFGFYEDGSQKIIKNMTESDWYINDTFGLKTLDEAGKIDFYTTPGDHLKFTNEFLMGLVDKYFTN